MSDFNPLLDPYQALLHWCADPIPDIDIPVAKKLQLLQNSY
jgi:hypothetical protein